MDEKDRLGGTKSFLTALEPDEAKAYAAHLRESDTSPDVVACRECGEPVVWTSLEKQP